MVIRAAVRRRPFALAVAGWLLALAALSAAPATHAAVPPLEVPLWPADAPGSSGLVLAENISERSTDPSRHDRVVSGVLQPTLTVFAPDHANGTGVIIAPGGGYVRESFDREGTELAAWFAAQEITAFVLKYRLPAEGHAQRADVPLQDAQRAMRLVRARAAEFGVDTARLGCLGFSAGGHLAASLATRFDAVVYAPVDAADSQSARPDFSILLYPVISMTAEIAHAGSRNALLGGSPSESEVVTYSAEQNVTSSTPPSLVILADDDATVQPENSLRYYRALHQAGVRAELHVFAAGRHGFGLRAAQGSPVASWPEVALAWLVASGSVPAPAPPAASPGARRLALPPPRNP